VTNVHGTRVKKAVVHSICNVRLLARRLVSSLWHTFGTLNRLRPILFFVISIYVGLGNILEWVSVNSLIRHIHRPSIVQITAATTDSVVLWYFCNMYTESVSFCVLNRQKLRTVDYYRLLILSGDFFLIVTGICWILKLPDNTEIFSLITSHNDRERLQEDWSKLTTWSEHRQMTFNVSKYIVMYFGWQKQQDHCYYMNN